MNNNPNDFQQCRPIENADHITRAQLEDLIESLIGLLDAIDDDPDLETDADFEPSVGGGSGDERELDTSDYEPTLGGGRHGDDRELDYGEHGVCMGGPF